MKGDRKVVRNVNNLWNVAAIRRGSPDHLTSIASGMARQHDLERMYTRAFGFKKMYAYIGSAVMAGRLLDALKKCQAR